MEKGPGCDPRPFVTPRRVEGQNGSGASTSVVAVSIQCPRDAANGSLGAKLIGRHLARALVLHELEGDLLTFAQIAHASALDGADVDENVLSAIIRLDETKTLGRIEPLDCTDAHNESFRCVIVMARDKTHAPAFRFFEQEGRQQAHSHARGQVVRPKYRHTPYGRLKPRMSMRTAGKSGCRAPRGRSGALQCARFRQQARRSRTASPAPVPVRENPVAQPVPPHRRQGRLQPAGRPRPRPPAPGLARRAGRGSRRSAPARAPMCWSSPRARSRSAAPCSACPRGPLRLEESQAAAAVGQIALARTWSEALGHHGLTAGQILLTLADTEERRRYLNARATLGRLLDLRAVPVINENDTVATTEIRYGDNDRLAARVATMAGADLLVLFSDIDGLYTAPPAQRPGRAAYPAGRAHHAGDRRDGGRRGLRTVARRHAHQDRGRQDRGRRRHAHADRRRARQEPARGHRGRRALHLVPDRLQPRHRAQDLDRRLARAARRAVSSMPARSRALRGGASLLPVGVSRIEGDFARGDAVLIRDAAGAVLGRGLVAYDAARGRARAGQGLARHRGDPGLSRPRRDDPPGRHGARASVKVDGETGGWTGH